MRYYLVTCSGTESPLMQLCVEVADTEDFPQTMITCCQNGASGREWRKRLVKYGVKRVSNVKRIHGLVLS